MATSLDNALRKMHMNVRVVNSRTNTPAAAPAAVTPRRERCKGFLVAVEGIDGCGKTTLVNSLIDECTYLIQGYSGKPLGVRQPGGSVYGEAVRNIARQAKIDAFTQALIYTSSHYDAYTQEMVPYLNNDGIVIADRFINTLFAYQGLFGGQANLVNDILMNVPSFQPPDLTLYLSLPLQVSLDRQGKRVGEDDDRYAASRLADKRRLKRWYDALHTVDPESDAEDGFDESWLLPAAARYRERFTNYEGGGLEIIDATQSKEKMLAQAYSAITRQLEKITCSLTSRI